MTLKLNSFLLIAFGCCLISFAGISQDSPNGLKVGDEAINFVGKDQDGKSFELYSALEKGPVVLMFYRGYWCGYCNNQLSQLQDSLNFITDMGGIVVAVTPEKPESISKTIDKTKASFSLIYDEDLKIMNSYDVAFRLEESLLKKYDKWGIDLKETNGSNGPNLPVPATYIIGQDKKIIYAFFDPNYKKRATVGNILQNL